MTSKTTELFNPEIKQFLIKSSLFMVLLGFFISIFMPDISIVKSFFENEKIKVLVYGFEQNPVALYRAALLDEKIGHFGNAAMEMDLAVGLLEMHNADREVINRYKEKQKALEDRIHITN